MPTKKTIERAKADEREGKAPTTQAGEFVREEMEHVREGKHGASGPKQAIAIGLSKARRAGVKVPRPKKGRAAAKTRTAAKSRTAPKARKRAGTKRTRPASSARKTRRGASARKRASS